MSDENKPKSETRAEKETSRLEAFSDGVFAFAMTLLVLDLKVPQLDGKFSAHDLAKSLFVEWPSYFAFVTSYLTVLIMWVHHHTLFRWVRCLDVRLLFTNGFLLLMVTTVAFPTAVVAKYLRTDAASAACEFYAGYFVLVSISFWLVREAATRPCVLLPEVSKTMLHRWRRYYRLGPLFYIIAAVVAPFSPVLTMAICTAMWILWAVSTRDADAD